MQMINAYHYQKAMKIWLDTTFGEVDIKSRYHRFCEESLELLQAGGISKVEIQIAMDSVYSKPIGDKFNEVGGVFTTLTGLCVYEDIDLTKAANIELQRCWNRVEEIREKDKQKALGSPLAGGNRHLTDDEILQLDIWSVSLRLQAKEAGVPFKNIIPYTRNNWPSTYEENGEIYVELDLPINTELKMFQAAHELSHVYLKHVPNNNSFDNEYEANVRALTFMYDSVNNAIMEASDEILEAVANSLVAYTHAEVMALSRSKYVVDISDLFQNIQNQLTKRTDACLLALTK